MTPFRKNHPLEKMYMMNLEATNSDVFMHHATNGNREDEVPFVL